MKPRTWVHLVHQTRKHRTSASFVKIAEAETETFLLSLPSWRYHADCRGPIFLSFGNGAPEHHLPQISQPYDTVDLTIASNKRLIMRKDVLQWDCLYVAAKQDQAPLPFWSSLLKAGVMLPDS